jgi:flagellin-specific chaperone FliS
MKIRFVLSFVALVSAVSILFVSLSSASLHSVQSASGSFQQTRKQFYVSSKILPDHVAYPILMGIDRVRLESTTPVEQVYMKTAYANRRLESAKSLLEKGENELAVSTLTKAQKYLLSAGNQVLDLEMSTSVTRHVLETIEFHIAETQQLAGQLSDRDRAVIDGLNEECGVMTSQLQSRL